jgi:uncharacterized protein YdhG (YjbR/CyaY superfamily)
MSADNERMDRRVRDYVDGIAPENRALFDRIHRLVLAAYPDAGVVLSYQMPTYKVGRRRMHVGAWKHGLSIYGWPQERGGEFLARHPGLATGKGTIRVRPEDAAGLSDEEFLSLIRAALEP